MEKDNNKRLSVVNELSGEEMDDYIISNSPAIMKKVEKSYRNYLKKGGFSLNSVIKKLMKKKTAGKPFS